MTPARAATGLTEASIRNQELGRSDESNRLASPTTAMCVAGCREVDRALPGESWQLHRFLRLSRVESYRS
jgi:hypothetical protein